MAIRTLIVNTMPPGPTEDRMGEEGGILRARKPDPPDRSDQDYDDETRRRSQRPPTRLTADGYRIEGDDPSIVPWGYFEDDDL